MDTDGFDNSERMKNVTDGRVFPAANFCRTLSLNGYTDWYLPARNEMSTIGLNEWLLPSSERFNSNGLSSVWTSSQSVAGDVRYGYLREFSTVSNSETLEWKNTNRDVRAIRRIAIT